MLRALVFAIAAVAAAQSTFTPFHADGIYAAGEKAGWSVALPPGAAYSYSIRKNNAEVIQAGTLESSTGAATLETRLEEPAMLYVEVRPPQGPAIHLGAAVAPWKLRPAVPRPADFDAFWDGKLAALREIPIHPVLTPVPTTQPGVELFSFKLDSLGSHVRGYLARPNREGKFPALVVFQYAGVYALQPQTVTDRAAEGWLAFDVDSHDIAPDTGEGVPKNYQAIGNTDREKSYFLGMCLRDTRAIDYIASRPDWDGRTLVATGTSMGGQQSFAAAALNPRVTAVIVNEPAGADSNADLHGRRAGYPNWPSDNPQAMETALYFDIVNFAPRIQAPVLAGIGFIDTIAPPSGIWTAVNQLAGPYEVVGMVESDHNNITPDKQGAFLARSREVFELLLRGGEFHPRGNPVERRHGDDTTH